MNATTATSSAGSIAAYFENQSDARRAVEALRDAGFASAQVGAAHRDDRNASAQTSTGQKAEGAWEKFKSFFTGDPEPYAEERTRGDLATREITNYDTTSSRDDFHQNLSGLSVPEDRSHYMSHRFHGSQDGAIVTVNAGDRAAEAQEILQSNGGDLGENAANYDYSQSQGSTEGANVRNIQLLGEILGGHIVSAGVQGLAHPVEVLRSGLLDGTRDAVHILRGC